MTGFVSGTARGFYNPLRLLLLYGQATLADGQKRLNFRWVAYKFCVCLHRKNGEVEGVRRGTSKSHFFLQLHIPFVLWV